MAALFLEAFNKARPHLGDALKFNSTAFIRDPVFATFCGGTLIAISSLIAFDIRKNAKQKAKSKPKRNSRKSQSKKTKPKVDSVFFKRLWKLFKIIVPTPLSRMGGLFLVQFILLIFRTFITIRLVKINVRFLTQAITLASWKVWARWLINFFGWMICGVITNTGLKYTEMQIMLSSRERLTRYAHDLYFKSNAFYKASVLQMGSLKNLDQRICSDILEFSKSFAHIYGYSFKPTLEFFLGLNESSKELGWLRLLLLYFAQIVLIGILRPLVSKDAPMIAYEQEMEGMLRHAHMRLITHAEEIAFLRGSTTEKQLLNDRFLVNLYTRSSFALKRVSKWTFQQFMKFQGNLVGGIFITVPFLLKGDLDQVDRISRFRETESLIKKTGQSFTEMILLTHAFSELSGYTARIVELFELLENDLSHNENPVIPFADGIIIDSLTVQTPDENPRILVRDLNLVVKPGQSYLITGPNGCGKTSLFRTLAGLWAPLSGTVSCPAKGITWVPQSPYLVMGTLRDQVTYPDIKGYHDIDDEKARECLIMAGLDKILNLDGGLDQCPSEWNDVLSGGERQRVAFARLFYHNPMFAVLDEATSAINPDEEAELYQKVLESNCTVFSIAHRLALRKFHDFELNFIGDGSGKFNIVDLTEHNQQI